MTICRVKLGAKYARDTGLHYAVYLFCTGYVYLFSLCQGTMMTERILNLLTRAMALTEEWDNDPTIQGTRELYEALACAQDALKECYHAHDVLETY